MGLVLFSKCHSEKESKNHMISPHGLEFYLIFGVDWFDLFRNKRVSRLCLHFLGFLGHLETMCSELLLVQKRFVKNVCQ